MKSKGDILSDAPITIVVPLLGGNKTALPSPSGPGLGPTALSAVAAEKRDSDSQRERDHLDTPDLAPPALSPCKSQRLEIPGDTAHSDGLGGRGDLALSLDSTSTPGQAGGVRQATGDDDAGGALSCRDGRRFDGEDGAARSYLVTPHTAPETPFVSIPSTSGLSYVENHTNRAMPDVSSIRGRASSIGNDSDTDQADQTQGLDQAQDILNGLDV